MTIFSKVRDFLSRHRNKFVVGGVIVTGTILLSRYAQQRLREWQEQEAKDFLERTRKRQHFESTERTCNQTILSLLPTLNESLVKTINTEDIIAELRKNPNNKVELWEDLKILVFTRASCFIYISTMLVVTLRMQLNIIGGYLFRSPTSLSAEVQQQFLSMCHNLLDSGISTLSTILQSEYKKIIQMMDLKKELKLRDLENIFWAIQTATAISNSSPIDKLKQYVIKENVPNASDEYNNMVHDIADLLDSDEVKALVTSHISKGFLLLEDEISEFYGPKVVELPSSSATSEFVHPSQVQIPIAKLIPVINGLLSKLSLPNKLFQQLLNSDKIKILGANVYEAFS